MDIKKIIILSLIFVLYSTTICHALDLSALDKLDIIGNNFLTIGRRLAKWIVVIMGTMECIKCALNHNKSGAGNAIITYGAIYLAMYFIPYIMDTIDSIFA